MKCHSSLNLAKRGKSVNDLEFFLAGLPKRLLKECKKLMVWYLFFFLNVDILETVFFI